MKKSLGLSCIVNRVYVSPNILYPKCWVIKGNRRGYFETRGGAFETNFRLPGGGGYVQWGGGNLKLLHWHIGQNPSGHNRAKTKDYLEKMYLYIKATPSPPPQNFAPWDFAPKGFCPVGSCPFTGR